MKAYVAMASCLTDLNSNHVVTAYNTRTHACCNRKTIYERLTEVCCDGSVHPAPYKHFTGCCGKKAYSLTERCCNGKIYDSTFEKCASGNEVVPLDTPKSANCPISGGTGTPTTKYVPFREVCCDGRVFKKSTTCCNGTVGFHPGPAKCCGGVVYDGMDRCCDGKPYLSTVQGCCGGKMYRHGKEICCKNQVNEISSVAQFCCGNGTYDVNFDACCNAFQSVAHRSISFRSLNNDERWISACSFRQMLEEFVCHGVSQMRTTTGIKN